MPWLKVIIGAMSRSASHNVGSLFVSVCRVCACYFYVCVHVILCVWVLFYVCVRELCVLCFCECPRVLLRPEFCVYARVHGCESTASGICAYKRMSTTSCA